MAGRETPSLPLCFFERTHHERDRPQRKNANPPYHVGRMADDARIVFDCGDYRSYQKLSTQRIYIFWSDICSVHLWCAVWCAPYGTSGLFFRRRRVYQAIFPQTALSVERYPASMHTPTKCVCASWSSDIQLSFNILSVLFVDIEWISLETRRLRKTLSVA